jgi:hypothetical protein
VPVVTGEFDEDNFDEPTCATKTPSAFDTDYMDWADSAGVSYLAWGWIVEPKNEQAADGCSAFYLIGDYTNYTPAQPNGVALHDHLHALASTSTATSTTTRSATTPGSTSSTTTTPGHGAGGGSPKPPVTLEAFSASTGPDGRRAAFTMRSAQNCTGELTGETINSYGSAERTRRKISLGVAHFTLKAGEAKTVTLNLPKAVRELLIGKRSLKVQVTITLTSPQSRPTITHHTVTLNAG